VTELAALETNDNLLRRVRAEYLDMPGLRLSANQAARLFGLSPFVVRELLNTLADTGFLIRPPDGGYYYRSGSDGRHPR
jgi:DNA-binding GntR family transcriptional regulator